MRIRDCVKRRVVSVSTTTSLGEATRLLVEERVSLLPVTNHENKLVGTLALDDVLAPFLPDFARLMENIDFVRDFGALEELRVDPTMRARLVSDVMREPVSVEETAGLLRTYTMMWHHEIYDLPIVKPDGTLVGSVSRMDISIALMSRWEASHPPPQANPKRTRRETDVVDRAWVAAALVQNN